MAAASGKIIENLVLLFENEEMMDFALGKHKSDRVGDLDMSNLFTVVENVLSAATLVAINKLDPTGLSQAQTRTTGTLPEDFIPPTSIMNETYCLMTCKLDTNHVHQTVESLFETLSHCSWVSKAVATLSGFAMPYGDFWSSPQIQTPNHFAYSVAMLKGYPVTKDSLDEQKGQIFKTLNNLVEIALKMTKRLVEFEQNSKDVPELWTWIGVSKSTVSYQIVIIVLVCSTLFDSILSRTCNYQIQHELSGFTEKATEASEGLNVKIEEIREYQRLKRLFRERARTVDLIKALFYSESELQMLYSGKSVPQKLYSCSKRTSVAFDKIDELMGEKSFLFLISDLKVDNDLENFKSIYNNTNFSADGYQVLWIPIDEDGDQNQFKTKQNNMLWYSPYNIKHVRDVAVRVIKEEWKYKRDSIVVVLNPLGKVLNKNAMPMIRIWQDKAFPFSRQREDSLWKQQQINWFELLVKGTIEKIEDAIDNEKVIFLYGGEDKETIENFQATLQKIAQDDTIVWFNANMFLIFFARLESCMVSKMKISLDVSDSLMQDLLSLYGSYKRDRGFAIVSKGKSVVVNGTLVNVLHVLLSYENWRKQMEENGKTFEEAFKDSYNVVSPFCHQFYIPNMTGSIPDDVRCPKRECGRLMKNIVVFECCHGQN